MVKKVEHWYFIKVKYNILKQTLQVYKYSGYRVSPSYFSVPSQSIFLYLDLLYTHRQTVANGLLGWLGWFLTK